MNKPSPAVRRSFLFELASTTFVNGLIMICGLATGVLIARILGPAGRGDFAIIQLYGTIAATFCTSGLTAATIVLSSNDRRKIPEALTSALPTVAALSIVAVLIAESAISSSLSAKPADVQSTASIYLLYIPLATCSALFWASLQSASEISRWNVQRLLFSSLWLIPVLFVYLFFKLSPAELAILYLCFLGVSAVYFVYSILRTYGRELRFSRHCAGLILRNSVPTSLAATISQASLKPDLIFLSITGPSFEVGLYAVAQAYASLQSGVLASLLQLLLPTVSRSADRAQQIAIASRLCRVAVVAASVLACLLAVVCPLLLPLLFGMEFANAVIVGVILSAAAAILFANAVLSDCLRALTLPGKPLTAELLGLGVIASFLSPAYRAFGIFGVASLSVAGASVGFLFLAWSFASASHASYRDFLLMKRYDMAELILRIRRAMGRSGITPSAD